MSNSTLNNLLKEYEEKRLRANLDAEKRKEDLYSSNKRLQEIDEELHKIGFNKINSILNDSSISINDLLENINNLKIEKDKILNKLNINADYLLPKYECSLCNDTGFIKNNNSYELCSCIKQKIFDIEYNKSNLGNLEKDNFDNFNINLYSNDVDIDKYSSKISPRQNILNIKKIIDNFITNFDNPEEKNLLFTGDTGLGKTFLSNCIANEILKLGKTVLYQTAPNMLDTIIDYRFGKDNVPNNIYENTLNVDLLIIDDLGTESMNSMKYTELFNIINSRLLNQNNHITKTIISTNLNIQNLFDTYNERIASRFVGYYNICRFFGDDIRFKKN